MLWITRSTLGTGMRYCVFALGNTLYEKYNTVGKLYDERCEKLGGLRLFDIGLGDDDGSIQVGEQRPEGVC